MGPHTHTLHAQGRTEEISPATWKVETLLWKFHQRYYEESTFKEQTSKELQEIKKNIILCRTFWSKLMPSLQMDKPKKRNQKHSEKQTTCSTILVTCNQNFAIHLEHRRQRVGRSSSSSRSKTCIIIHQYTRTIPEKSRVCCKTIKEDHDYWHATKANWGGRRHTCWSKPKIETTTTSISIHANHRKHTREKERVL